MKNRTKVDEERPVYVTEAGRICGVSGPTFKRIAERLGIKPEGFSGKRRYAYWTLKTVFTICSRIDKHRAPGLPIHLK
jgi:hypothetical protein